MHILYQMHIAWFETDMALKTILSLEKAISNTDLDVQIKLCFNTQTRFDTPVSVDPKKCFDRLLENEIVKNSQVVWKTDEDEFYNVGDWRRECYDAENITVWGESDCYVPETYFWYIQNAFSSIKEYPFVVTIRQKKMWDDSWKTIEHEAFQSFTIEQVRSINNKFVTGEGYLSLEELNDFNESFSSKHHIVRSNYYKGDGALVCLSPKMPTPFIHPKINVFGEDTYFFNYCEIKKIPLYNICYYLKGHNTNHPQKKVSCLRTEEQKLEIQKFDHLMRIYAREGLTQLIQKL